jgi:hypothetical protein
MVSNETKYKFLKTDLLIFDNEKVIKSRCQILTQQLKAQQLLKNI